LLPQLSRSKSSGEGVSTGHASAAAADSGAAAASAASAPSGPQHLVTWEAVAAARTGSPWHGPFSSDGAARRHMHQQLDFQHLCFEIVLRVPLAQVQRASESTFKIKNLS
jgi:hypothetical protein